MSQKTKSTFMHAHLITRQNLLFSPNSFLFSNLEVFENVVVEIRMKYDTRKNVCTTLILVYFISLFLTISIEILR